MWKWFPNVLTAILFLSFTATQALAAATARLEQNGFGSGPIEVISQDGVSWTGFRDAALTLPVKVFVGISNTSSAEYDRAIYTIFQGAEELISKSVPNGTEHTHELTGSTENLSSIDRIAILNLCNAKLNTGDGINQDHTTMAAVTVRISAVFDEVGGVFEFDSSSADFGPVENSGTVGVPVKCVGIPEPEDATVAFKVNDIDLSISTPSNATTQPNAGTVCNKGRLKVRVATTTTGPAKFKLWKKVGGGAMTAKVINAYASNDGNGGFAAEHVEWISVNKTSQVQAKAEDMVNTIGESTGWKTKMLRCEDGVGGGITSDLPNPDDPVPIKKLAGDFSFIDRGSPKCERTGHALINFTNVPSTANAVHWSLDCHTGAPGGKHFSGTALVVNGPKGRVAPDTVRFDIAKTTTYKCALKTVSPGKAKLHKLKGHKFRCFDSTVNTDVNDLTNGSQPDPVVDPDTCKRTEKRIKIRGKWTCVPKDPVVIADPIRCKRTEKRIKVRGKWMCVPKDPVVIADPIKCKRSEKRIQLSNGKWACVPKGPDLVVDPIKCKRTEKRVMVRGKWVCVPKGPDTISDAGRYTCNGGRVLFSRARNATPFCKCFNRKRKPVKKGPYIWVCEDTTPVAVGDPVKKQPCKNGRIVRGACICRSNANLIKGVCTPVNVVNKRLLKLKQAQEKKAKALRRLKLKQAADKKAKTLRDTKRLKLKAKQLKLKRDADKRAKRLKAKREAAKRLKLKQAQQKALRDAARRAANGNGTTTRIKTR